MVWRTVVHVWLVCFMANIVWVRDLDGNLVWTECAKCGKAWGKL